MLIKILISSARLRTMIHVKFKRLSHLLLNGFYVKERFSWLYHYCLLELWLDRLHSELEACRLGVLLALQVLPSFK